MAMELHKVYGRRMYAEPSPPDQGGGGRITPEQWIKIQARIKQAHQDPNRILGLRDLETFIASYLEQGELDAAIAYLDAALQIINEVNDPMLVFHLALRQINLAVLNHQAGRSVLAEDLLRDAASSEKYASVDPDELLPQIAIGYVEINQPEKAFALASSIKDSTNRFFAYRQGATKLIEQGQLHWAKQFLLNGAMEIAKTTKSAEQGCAIAAIILQNALTDLFAPARCALKEIAKSFSILRYQERDSLDKASAALVTLGEDKTSLVQQLTQILLNTAAFDSEEELEAARLEEIKNLLPKTYRALTE